MKKRFILLLLITNVLLSNAQLTNNSKVSILTCAPGPELYSLFGHTALHIKDDARGIDLVFNYGLFSFKSENFYYNFFRGYTDYILGVQRYSYFMSEFIAEKRNVWSHELNLTLEEKNAIYAALKENLKPENKSYRYNYFTNNCATKVLDLAKDYSTHPINWYNSDGKSTYRKGIKPFLEAYPWVRFGVDLLLGAPADTTITTYELMFLPENMMRTFEKSTFSNTQPVLSRHKLINKGDAYKQDKITPTHPIIISSLLLLISILFFFSAKSKYLLFMRNTFYIALSLAGLFIIFLTTLSVHPTVNTNFNLLWINPFIILIPIFERLAKTTKAPLVIHAANCTAILLFFIIVLAGVQIGYYPIYLLALTNLAFSCSSLRNMLPNIK